MLTVRQLNKHYTDKHVLKEVSFRVPPGSVYGLMGPNGAGKTTLIRTLTRLTRPDSGTVHFGGEIMEDTHKRFIGYMPEERGLYTGMKVAEHIRYFIDLYDLDPVSTQRYADELLERLGIAHATNKRVRELSKGMSQKVQFIITVLHTPRLLVLDEPFSGLDPSATAVMEEVLSDIRCQHGTTILLSTHRMEQMEHLCESVLLLNQGQIVAQGPVKELKQTYSQNVVQIDYLGPQPCLCDYPAAEIRANSIRVVGQDSTYSNAILRKLLDDRVTVERFEHAYPSLREIFLTEVNAN